MKWYSDVNGDRDTIHRLNLILNPIVDHAKKLFTTAWNIMYSYEIVLDQMAGLKVNALPEPR